MKRKDIIKKMKLINAELISLKEEDKIFTYVTNHGFVHGFGYVAEIEEIPLLVTLHSKLNKKPELDESIRTLGITNEEMADYEHDDFQGYKLKHWNMDIETRLEEIRRNRLIENLRVAHNKLSSWLSDNDKFSLDMEEISDVLSMDFLNN